MGFSYIPDDDTIYVYLYHPDFLTAKRIRRYGPDGPTAGRSDEWTNLERQGWTTNRYAQTLYHEVMDPVTLYRPEEVERALTEGWTTTPHPKGHIQHPHANDTHRKRFLAAQKPKPSMAAR